MWLLRGRVVDREHAEMKGAQEGQHAWGLNTFRGASLQSLGQLQGVKSPTPMCTCPLGPRVFPHGAQSWPFPVAG